MSTYFETAEQSHASRRWLTVDAKGKTLGRLASEVASLLRGKNKPTFSPHVDGGDFVVIINAEQIKLSGNKLETKLYKHHTGYIGGIKEISAGKLLQENPERMIEQAVWGMIPKGPLGRRVIKKLKIYRGDVHPHQAQQSEVHTLKYQ